MTVWLLVLFRAAFESTVAHAQLNAEPLRPNPFREGWSGTVDASFALSRGNVEFLDVGGGARIQHQTLYPQAAPTDGSTPELPFIRQRFFLAANGRFTNRTRVAFINQTFGHLGWIRMWHERVGSQVFAQYLSNQFQRLRGRAIGVVSARFEVVHNQAFQMWAATGYLFEYDRIDVQQGAVDSPETVAHRWANALVMRLPVFSKQLLLQNTIQYQPRFDAFSDFRLFEEFEVLARVTEYFGLGVSVSVLHDSAPPTGVLNTDLRLVTTVRLSL